MIYKTRCGRRPAAVGADLKRTEALSGPWWGSQDDMCESCLRSWASSGKSDTPSAEDPTPMLTWMRRRPGLVWHLLIPTWYETAQCEQWLHQTVDGTGEYAEQCILESDHKGKHRDQNGQEWEV